MMMGKGLNTDISLNRDRKHLVCMIVKTVYWSPFVLEKVKNKQTNKQPNPFLSN